MLFSLCIHSLFAYCAEEAFNSVSKRLALLFRVLFLFGYIFNEVNFVIVKFRGKAYCRQ